MEPIRLSNVITTESLSVHNQLASFQMNLYLVSQAAVVESTNTVTDAAFTVVSTTPEG